MELCDKFHKHSPPPEPSKELTAPKTLLWASQLAQWKESACQCRRRGLDPWIRKIPWSRERQYLPVFLTGNFHVQQSLSIFSFK